jgi:hypothetical protein
VGEFLARLDQSALPADLQPVMTSAQEQIKEAKHASIDIASHIGASGLYDENGTFKTPSASASSSSSSSSRRRLFENEKKENGDPFAQFKSSAHPKFRHHLDLQDAIMNGDMAFVHQKLHSLGEHMDHHSDRTGRSLFSSGAEAKLAKCIELMECVSSMSLYDLFIFFFADDIDFETGELDDTITNADADNIFTKRDVIATKLAAAKILVEGSGVTFLHDACDGLLQEFHRNVEPDVPLPVRWVGSSVIDVCRGRGTTNYVSFTELESGPTKTDPTPRFPEESDFIFEDLVLCAKTLHENKPPQYDGEDFVFVREASGQRFLRVPKSVDGTRDVHGEFTAGGLDIDILFDYEELSKWSVKMIIHLLAHVVISDLPSFFCIVIFKVSSSCFLLRGCDLFSLASSAKHPSMISTQSFSKHMQVERPLDLPRRGCTPLHIWTAVSLTATRTAISSWSEIGEASPHHNA